jgi:hypothetical protein
VAPASDADVATLIRARLFEYFNPSRPNTISLGAYLVSTYDLGP